MTNCNDQCIIPDYPFSIHCEFLNVYMVLIFKKGEGDDAV
jgi:hypothetical protein